MILLWMWISRKTREITRLSGSVALRQTEPCAVFAALLFVSRFVRRLREGLPTGNSDRLDRLLGQTSCVLCDRGSGAQSSTKTSPAPPATTSAMAPRRPSTSRSSCSAGTRNVRATSPSREGREAPRPPSAQITSPSAALTPCSPDDLVVARTSTCPTPPRPWQIRQPEDAPRPAPRSSPDCLGRGRRDRAQPSCAAVRTPSSRHDRGSATRQGRQDDASAARAWATCRPDFDRLLASVPPPRRASATSFGATMTNIGPDADPYDRPEHEGQRLRAFKQPIGALQDDMAGSSRRSRSLFTTDAAGRPSSPVRALPRKSSRARSSPRIRQSSNVATRSGRHVKRDYRGMAGRETERQVLPFRDSDDDELPIRRSLGRSSAALQSVRRCEREAIRPYELSGRARHRRVGDASPSRAARRHVPTTAAGVSSTQRRGRHRAALREGGREALLDLDSVHAGGNISGRSSAPTRASQPEQLFTGAAGPHACRKSPRPEGRPRRACRRRGFRRSSTTIRRRPAWTSRVEARTAGARSLSRTSSPR